MRFNFMSSAGAVHGMTEKETKAERQAIGCIMLTHMFVLR